MYGINNLAQCPSSSAGGVKRSHREKGSGEPVRVPWRVPDRTKLEVEGGFALQPQVGARPRAVEPAKQIVRRRPS